LLEILRQTSKVWGWSCKSSSMWCCTVGRWSA